MSGGIKERVCPKCGGKMTPVFNVIGGFPGHPHTHGGRLLRYECKCGYKIEVK